MDVAGLVPLMVPVLMIMGAAVMVVARARPRREVDVVLDLRDVPTVRLADEKDTWVPEHQRRWELTGELVSAGGGSLGARMHEVAESEQQQRFDQPPPPKAAPRVVVRRRRRPLVAARR